MPKRKYEQGGPIINFSGLFYHINRSGVVYLRDKVKSEGWIMSMQLRHLKNLMDNNLIKVAIKINKEAK